MRRTHFDPGPAPVNYVPGLGRGATGFTTRSDIGDARVLGKRAPDEHQDLSESQFDKFSGYSHSLFAGSPYDEEDEEADRIWKAVDERMEERGKDRREKRQKLEMERYRKENPKLQLQFADIKSKLENLSADDWSSLPDIGDRSQPKSQPTERFVPVPDSMLVAQHAQSQHANSIDASAAPVVAGDRTDLTQLGRAQKRQLDTTLAKASSTVAGQTVVNASGYMTDLNSLQVNTEADMMDINKARDLLKSVTSTNPKHAPGWIAYARLEEVAGKLARARKIVVKGTMACPKNEDVWLEAARLHSPQEAKAIFARAVSFVPRSVKLWIHAAKLETDVEGKKRVLHKGLELIPDCIPLWKHAIELEEPSDAKVMLEKAVECVPHGVDLWLALAHLCEYKEAQKVLNRARKAIPTDASIWITAARLEEAAGKAERVTKIVERAVKSLSAHNVIISREKWLELAEQAELGASPLTCRAIVRTTIGQGVEQVDMKRIWLEDAAGAIQRGSYHTARAIYEYALELFPKKKSMWRRYIELESAHGTSETLDGVLKQAIQHCPQAEVLWLIAAKQKWLENKVDEARSILEGAFRFNPSSERIWLAAAKVEIDSHQVERARALLEKARSSSGSAKLWIKSCKLERQTGNSAAERQLLEQAIAKFPKVAKFWLLFSQLEQRLDNWSHAHTLLERGVQNCPTAVQLWIQLARIEEKKAPAKARAVLEQARFKNPQNPELWVAAIRTERRAQSERMAENLMAKALQECANSGLLWAEAIATASKQRRRQRCIDGLKKCDSDARVLLAVARVFWKERRMEKARSWLERALSYDALLGDAWANLLAFEQQNGTEEAQQKVLQRCEEAKPKRGEHWCSVSKALGNEDLTHEEICKRVAAIVGNVNN